MLSTKNKSVFETSKDEQSSFLESLGEAKDDFDRSYKQYLCQSFFSPRWKTTFLDVIAAIIIFFVFFYLLFIRFRRTKKEPVEAAAIFRDVPEVIPEELYERFSIKKDCMFDGYSLNFSDLSFIQLFFFRYLTHPYFVLKSIFNIAKYSYLIDRYQPKCIIVHAEFAFSSSLLTQYCHFKNVKHINVMHGEKLYFIRDSFFHYDECFVWDKYYIDLFISLKAESNQFRIAVPKSLIIDTEHYIDNSLYADYKYYLVNCSGEELRGIIKSLSFVRKNGNTVKLRPHPRWTDISLLESLLPKEEIEYPENVSIMQSVANLSYAVGSYTTVLNQAVHSGKDIVLDDVTYKDQYDKLRDLKYILANRDYLRLSELQ